MRDIRQGHQPGGATRGGPWSWLTQPPYPGLWALGGLGVLALFAALVLMTGPQPERSTTTVVTPPPQPVERPVVAVAPEPARPEPPPVTEKPQVTIRTRPSVGTQERQRIAGSRTESSRLPDDQPGTVAALPNHENTISAPPLEPAFPAPVETPPVASAPAPVPIPVPEEPVPAPRPRRRVMPAPAPVEAPAPPARETGRLAIYFDADSSTFGRNDRRLPLRVEVYVDGARVLSTDNPEKREFIIRGVPAGRHEIQIVPYVGDAPADPRREVVRVRPGGKTQYQAVLRREDGMSRISKFEERD